MFKYSQVQFPMTRQKAILGWLKYSNKYSNVQIYIPSFLQYLFLNIYKFFQDSVLSAGDKMKNKITLTHLLCGISVILDRS